MAYSSNVTVLNADDKNHLPPKGCAIVTVSDKVETHLMLKGIIDATKEIEKLEKKKIQLKNQYDKLTKATQIEGYDTKVPQDVRMANAEKCEQTQKELEHLAKAITALQIM